jgi:uncharacterized protein (TIGR02001 family)
MIKSRIAVAGALLAAAGVASAAGFSVTPTIASDYDFRGVSQTEADGDGSDPAFQLGANYAFDNGLYAGIWGSNVAFSDGLGGKLAKPDVELDYTLGYAGGDAAESFGYDFGVTYYSYLSAGELNTAEIYAGISKGWFSGKVWYSDDVASSKDSSFYVEGNATIPVSVVEGLSILAHVGMFDRQHAKSALDYSVGVGYTFGKFSTNLKYIDGDVDGAEWNNRFVLAVSTTFPWSE